MPERQHKGQQEPQTNNASTKKKKPRNRRKSSNDRVGPVVNSEPKELSKASGDSVLVAQKKPLQTSMTPTTSRKGAGSNWEAVAKAIQPKIQKSNEQENVTKEGEENRAEGVSTKSARRRQKRRAAEEKYVAIDCEMVGVGNNGQEDMLARVSIVNKRGVVLLDKFVKPRETVTDYRTSVSGIRPHNINNAEDFKSVQNEVVEILQGKILVGHGIRSDLAVLHINHPHYNIRDTTRYKPLCRTVANGRTPSLKRLTLAILGKEIQTGEHNSVEDAQAAMSIYNILASDWEAYLRKRQAKHK